MAIPIKVIMPAGELPNGARVTKKTGEKVYTLRDEVRMFATTSGAGDQAVVHKLTAGEGARFIVGENGDGAAIPSTLELVWHTFENDLRHFLDERFVKSQEGES